MNKLTQLTVLTVLALWSLAAMHCTLEAVPGLDFLKTCCFVDSASAAPADCDEDGCGAIEDGGYRMEEHKTEVPQPALALTLLSLLAEESLHLLQPQTGPAVVPSPPPALPQFWQFSYRTALPPRAPSSLA